MRYNSTPESNITRERVVDKKSDFLIDVLHIFVLFGFALAQPLFDLLSKYPEFLVVRKSEPVDVVLLILIVCLAPPAVAFLIELLAGLFGRYCRKVIHWFTMAVLSAVIVLQVLNNVLGLPGLVLLIGSATVGIAITIVLSVSDRYGCS